MYMLITGKPPFDGKDDREIVKHIHKQDYAYLTNPLFQQTSSECQELVRKMMQRNPVLRSTADEALIHPFIKQFAGRQEDINFTMRALQNLQKYNPQQNLQEAVISFIITHLATTEECIDLQKAFQVLDVDNDGFITKQELMDGYQFIYGDAAEEQVEAIFSKVDGDNSGTI